MRGTNLTPSIVPNEDDQTVYLVADDFKTGRVWRETEYDDTDLETAIQDLLTGQRDYEFSQSDLRLILHSSCRKGISREGGQSR